MYGEGCDGAEDWGFVLVSGVQLWLKKIPSKVCDSCGGSVFECGLDDKGYCPRCQAIRSIVSDIPEDDGKAIIGFKGERI